MAINEENVQKLKEELSFVEEALTSIGASLSKDINIQLEMMDDTTKKVAQSFEKDLGNAISSVSKSAAAQEKIIQKINKGQDASKDIAKEIAKAQSERTTILRKIEQLKRNSVVLEEKEIVELEAQLKTNEGIFESLQSQNDEMQEQLGLAGELLGGFGGILTKLGMGAKTTQLFTKGLAQAKVEGSGIGGAFKNITKNIIGAIKPTDILLFSIGGIVKALFKIDELSGQTAKNLGISYQESSKLTSEMNAFARESGDGALNTENMVKAQNELNNAFGTSTTLSTELTADFVKLTEQAGYAPEAMAKLAKITQSTGGDLSDNTAEMLGTVKALNTVNKLALNEKTLIEDIANVNAATTLSLGRQGKALAQNVFQARQFGITMDQAAGISNSLLDFQSSIEAELEAELLTGKELNLEQARYLALQGKTGEAAAAVLEQVGSAAEFGEMSVLAQEALAKAMGMEREALAASLIEREALQKVGVSDLEGARAKYDELVKTYGQEEAIKRLGDEKLAQQFASQDHQDKLNKATKKMQDIFIEMAQPLGNIVTQLVDLLIPAVELVGILLTPIFDTFAGIGGIITGQFSELSTTQQILGSIAGIVLTIYGLQKSILAIQALQKMALVFQEARMKGMNALSAFGAAIEETKLGSIIAQGAGILKNIGRIIIENAARLVGMTTALATNAAVTFGVGVAIAVAAAAAGYAAIKAMQPKEPQGAGDLISPADGKTQISTKEGGLFELSNNDDVIAAPGISNTLKNKGEKSSSTIDITPLIEQMNNMNATLSAILNKEGVVMLDSTKVGTALNVGSYKLQ